MSPWQVEWFDSVGSTNDVLAADPRPGRVVVADHQSAGRGRRGRSWQAPPGTSLAVSAALASPAVAAQGWVPLASGLAVARAFEASSAPVEVRLKWPNDVLAAVDGEWYKICGILAQRLLRPDHGAVLVIGTGVNIDQSRAELPVQTATSWRICRGGEPISAEQRVAWLAEYLRQLGELTRSPHEARADYLQRCDTLGHEVQVHLPGDRIATGRAVDIDPGGGLVLERGRTRTSYLAGDVVHLRR